MPPVVMASNSCHSSNIPAGIEEGARGLMPHVVEVKVHYPEIIAGGLERFRGGPRLMWENPRFRLAAWLSHDNVQRMPDKRQFLIVADLPARMLAIADKDNSTFLVKVCPAEAKYLTSAKGDESGEFEHIAHRNAGAPFVHEESCPFLRAWTAGTLTSWADKLEMV